MGAASDADRAAEAADAKKGSLLPSLADIQAGAPVPSVSTLGKPVIPDPSAVAQHNLTPGLGLPPAPVYPGDAGPPGTAPVAPQPIVQHDPNQIAVVDGKIIPFPFGTKNPDLNLTPPPAPEAKPEEPQIADVVPKAPEIQTVQKTTSPAVKDMIANVLATKAAPAGTNGNGFNFADLLRGAGGKLGDFLQRWGMGLMGDPSGLTQGDIQRQQAFELQKTQTQAQIQAQQMAVQNQYQQALMELDNQLKVANLPLEEASAIRQKKAELQAELANQLQLIPLQVQAALAQRQFTPGADPTNHLFSQGQ